MSFKVVRLTVGKGKTTGDEKQSEWIRRYYEAEITIDDEHDLEIAKASVEGLIDGWLTGTSIVEPQAQPAQKPKTEGLLEEPYNKLTWVEGTGAKGPYEMAREKDCDQTLFGNLRNVLRQNKDRFTEKSWIYFYWLGTEGNVIFRRKKKSK